MSVKHDIKSYKEWNETIISLLTNKELKDDKFEPALKQAIVNYHGAVLNIFLQTYIKYYAYLQPAKLSSYLSIFRFSRTPEHIDNYRKDHGGSRIFKDIITFLFDEGLKQWRCLDCPSPVRMLTVCRAEHGAISHTLLCDLRTRERVQRVQLLGKTERYG